MRILPDPILFEWDNWNKDKNWLKHKVSNQGCEEVFLVNRFLLLKDHIHSIIENRYIVLGPNREGKIFTIILTIRKQSIRVISARPATKKERNFYEKNFKSAQI